MIDGKYYLVNNFIKIIINNDVALQLKKKNQKDLVQTSLFTLSNYIKPHHQCSHNKILSTTYNLPPKIDSWHREDLNNVMSSLKNTKNCQLSYKAFGNQLELLYFYTSDGNQDGPSLKDPLQVPDGSITRSRAKKIKEAMQGLVQST